MFSAAKDGARDVQVSGFGAQRRAGDSVILKKFEEIVRRTSLALDCIYLLSGSLGTWTHPRYKHKSDM